MSKVVIKMKMKKEELKNKIEKIRKQATIYLLEKRKGEENMDFDFYDEADKVIISVASALNLRVTETFLSTIRDIAEAIADILEDTETEQVDSLRELFDEIELEVDIYTADLTGWLNEDIQNITFLSEAIQEHNPESGFDALATAQFLYKQEILTEFLSQLLKGDEEK